MVSAEDIAKAEGELKVADAQKKEATENQRSPRPTELAIRSSKSTRSSLPSMGSSSSG